MNKPREVTQFERIDTERLICQMERSGKYTVDSKIRGVSYVIKNDMIGIIAGKNGMLQIDIDRVNVFIKELQDIKELAEYKLALKGA